MITNKDISIENGNIILNGDKYPLDGQSPETIMGIVEDNSDTTPTENSTAPIKSGGVFTALSGKNDVILIGENTALSVDATYQIPSNFLDRTFIIISANRNNWSGSQIVFTGQIKGGDVSEGVKIVFGATTDPTLDKSAILTISNTGLMTLKNLTNMPGYVYFRVSAI